MVKRPSISGRLMGIGGSTSTVLYWPEFSTFLNKSGISRAGELPFTLELSGRWSLGIEGNSIGLNQGTDITVELARTLNQTKVSAKVTQNTQNGSFALASVRHQITKNASLVGQVFMTSGTSLIGERLSFGASRGGYFGIEFRF